LGIIFNEKQNKKTTERSLTQSCLTINEEDTMMPTNTLVGQIFM